VPERRISRRRPSI